MIELSAPRSRSLCVKFPRRIKQALMREAAARGESLNDAAGRLLGRHYRISFAGSGRPYRHSVSVDAVFVVLRLPWDLAEAIRADAYEQRTNQTHQVVLALAEALEVRLEDTAPKRRVPYGGGTRWLP